MHQNAFKKKQFPPQTGRYAVKVKNGAGWQQYNQARLQISVGMPYHEDDKFEATVNWVKERFDHVHICVNDTLQRYNYMSAQGIDEQEALALTLKEGEEWVARNTKFIQTLPSCSVYRWEEWRQTDDYRENYIKVQKLYNTNEEFRVAIDANVAEFMERREERGEINQNNRDRYNFFSREYLIEETAVFAMMFARNPAVDIYPGTVLLPCVIFRNRNLDGAPQGLNQGTFTRIDFSRNESGGGRLAA